ncbi:MAG: ABC transporter permease [Deferribacterales bacterium]|nr:ABC transporter permease [Deferribacterales bacterium]
MIQAVLIEGLIYGIMVLGVFITFRILDFPDLTVDGSFPLGAAVMAICLVSGVDPIVGTGLAIVSGIMAGMVTALLHTVLKIPNLLAGILTMTMLYSINLRIMGNKSNISLIKSENIVKDAENFLPGLPDGIAVLIIFLVIVLVIKLLLDLFFRTDMGLALGALGSNEQMIISQGMNPNYLKIIGVSLSNGLVALSGAFAAQYMGYADVNLGQGIVVAGLASVMIGEFLIKSNKISALTARVILGSIAYKAVMYAGRKYGYHIGLTPNDLKLITGVLIVFLIALSGIKKRRKNA